MSERELLEALAGRHKHRVKTDVLLPVHLRSWAKQYRSEVGYSGSMLESWLLDVADAWEKALADEPDAAAILRYADRLRDAAIAAEQPGGLAVADALLYVIEYITDEIGLRLTETGWEYVDG